MRCRVTGKIVNRGVGYGLEIPVKYIFYGHQKALEWMEKVFKCDADITNHMKNRCLK